MKKLQKGDRVECIDPGVGNGLTLKERYTVLKVGPVLQRISLDFEKYGMYERRRSYLVDLKPKSDSSISPCGFAWRFKLIRRKR